MRLLCKVRNGWSIEALKLVRHDRCLASAWCFDTLNPCDALTPLIFVSAEERRQPFTATVTVSWCDSMWNWAIAMACWTTFYIEVPKTGASCGSWAHSAHRTIKKHIISTSMQYLLVMAPTNHHLQPPGGEVVKTYALLKYPQCVSRYTSLKHIIYIYIYQKSWYQWLCHNNSPCL